MNNFKAKKTRLSIDFPAGSKEQLERLRIKSETPTLTEMFRRSTSYYECLLDAQARGFRIVLEHPDTKEREVLHMI